MPSFLCISLLLTECALADVVVLRDGRRLEGTLANRDVVQHEPAAFHYISFLVDSQSGSPSLQSYPVAEVEYVLLQDGDAVAVIDFHQAALQGKPMDYGTITRKKKHDIEGALLIIGGLTVGIIGAAVPFGDDEVRFSHSGTRVGETYNALNYSMMVGGAVLVMIGASHIKRGRTQAKQSFTLSPFEGGGMLRTAWKF